MVAVGFIPRLAYPKLVRRGATLEFGDCFQASLHDCSENELHAQAFLLWRSEFHPVFLPACLGVNFQMPPWCSSGTARR